MSRSIYKPVFLLIAFVCLQASGPLWAQSYGRIATIAGTGIQGFSGEENEARRNNPGSKLNVGAGDDGPATSAELPHPSGIAFDAAGNLYIKDTGHDRIRRVDGVGSCGDAV